MNGTGKGDPAGCPSARERDPISFLADINIVAVETAGSTMKDTNADGNQP